MKFFSIIFAVFLYFQVILSILKVEWQYVITQLRIRRLDTWRHRARDHWTRHGPLPTYWRSFGTKPLSQAISEILACKCIAVTTLTFQSHKTSSVTWPFDSQMFISYRCSIVTKSLSSAVFGIMGTKYIGVTVLTFQGHVTSSVTWPFDSQVAISYRCCIVIMSISSHFQDTGSKACWGHDLDLSGSHDVIGHVTIQLGMGNFLLVVLWTDPSLYL